jgi:predicted GIY-YIG superfamily endonuclease
MGIVYLIHFSEKLHHAQHYLGYCEDGNLAARMERHMSGNGSKLLKAVVEAGIEFQVAEAWPDADRELERKLKNSKNTKRLCPICEALEREAYDLPVGSKTVRKRGR